MPNPTLQPRSPLHGIAVPGRAGPMSGDAGVVVREIRDFHAIHIAARQGKASEIRAILSTSTGAEVVDAPRRISGHGLAIIGIAPAQWLAVERDVGPERLDLLRAQLAGLAAISEQGAGKLILEISGPRARDALCKGIPIDLHPAAFEVGSSAQTVAAYIGLQISLVSETPTFELISAASTAGSLWSWLTQSAHEFGLRVA